MKIFSSAQQPKEIVPPNILIMEDDSNIANGLKVILDEAGYNVDLQDTGKGAIDAMNKYNYNLLMADLRLPDVDGMDVLKEVKDTNPDTEVIVMTGYATNDLAVNAMKLGARDFIQKPFTEEQIKSAIDDALAANLSRIKKMSAADRKLAKASIEKREVLKILNRTAEDSNFRIQLIDKGSSALSEYSLSSEAKAAIASGDLKWINENIGELNQKQLMFIYKRLEQEAW